MKTQRPSSIVTVASILALGLLLGQRAYAGQVVDGVVAKVNDHVILLSDWEREVAIEAFSSVRDPEAFTAAERHDALDRLIDRELLREQVRPAQPAPSEQLAARVAAVRKLHPDCTTDAAWQAKLQRYGLSLAVLEKHLGEQIQLMKMVEDRLRPSVQVDQQAVENYYKDQLVPEMQRAGNKAAPLPEVFGRIKDLLAERKMNELLSGWLVNLRSGSHILFSQPAAGEQTR